MSAQQLLELLQSHAMPAWAQILIVLVVMHIDWFLGRTKRVTANNILESIGNGLKKARLHKVPKVGKILTGMASKEEAASAPEEKK